MVVQYLDRQTSSQLFDLLLDGDLSEIIGKDSWLVLDEVLDDAHVLGSAFLHLDDVIVTNAEQDSTVRATERAQDSLRMFTDRVCLTKSAIVSNSE